MPESCRASVGAGGRAGLWEQNPDNDEASYGAASTPRPAGARVAKRPLKEISTTQGKGPVMIHKNKSCS